MMPTLIPLDSPAALELAGGKGANLARLARAGFPVPPGFLVTTDAYRAFVVANGLEAASSAASDVIRAAFAAGALPAALRAELDAAYTAIGEPPVAVRSSATAEDLPDLSFAGQQDTYLNVRGADALARAVVDCWGSLWTARAIGYRARNAIDHSQVALAVVVQQMVQSEASGVLFTANPLTGLRAETVIDATVGLGEALVSGQVEPDHYVVETATGAIRRRTLGAKAISIRSLAGGGVERIEEEGTAARPALPDAVIAELARLGAGVVAEYGGEPQDIEWAWADGRLTLLQSRPITSLFPLPPAIPPDELAVFFSFGAVQGMLDPMTPLGQETFRHVSAGFARLWGYSYGPGEVPALHFAAERMWLRFDWLLRNGVGRAIFRRILSQIEAGTSQSLESILEKEPRLALLRDLPTPVTLQRIARLLRTLLPRVAAAMRDPDGRRAAAFDAVEERISALEARARAAQTLEARVALARAAFDEMSSYVLTVVPSLVVGMGSFFQMVMLAEKAGIPRSEALEVARGLPHNVTTEMDLALWQTAQQMRRDPAALAALEGQSADELAQAWLAGAPQSTPRSTQHEVRSTEHAALPPVAQQAMASFLDRYGVRGVAEIDFGRPRWRENPVQAFQMVQNYARIDDPALAPDAVFARAEAAGEAAVARLAAQIEAKLGRAAGQRARFFGARLRVLLGLRELPKFYVVRTMGVVRAALLESFNELAAGGVLAEAQDGFFLTLDELRALDAGYAIDWRALVRERRALYERERRRRAIPHLLLSDGRAFYGGAGASEGEGEEGVIAGTPVSPGAVEGIVRVVFDPHAAHLAPGEILVCPGTDPAWTPLFLSAGGLVMEVGGMMTHGSVVAREYGIPAVVGVARATERLRSGQRVRVDGSAGRVTVLDD